MIGLVVWVLAALALAFGPLLFVAWLDRLGRPTTTTTPWRSAVPRSHVHTIPPRPYDWTDE